MSEFEALFRNHQHTVDTLGIKLNPPASVGDIGKLELAVGHVLAQEIKDFYSYCNGFDTDDWMFNVLSIDQILSYKSELETADFYFAEYMIYSDSWKITVENEERFYITNGTQGKDRQLILTNSIHEFLKVYLNSKGVLNQPGLYKWP